MTTSSQQVAQPQTKVQVESRNRKTGRWIDYPSPGHRVLPDVADTLIKTWPSLFRIKAEDSGR